MERKYDLVIIGSGSAASSAAFYCSSNGLRVAVADSRPFGGTCALRGCDPKKVLYGVSGTPDSVSRLKGKGLRSSDVSVNWKELMMFKRTFTDPMPGELEEAMKKAGMDTYHGRAVFTGKNSLKVGNESLESRYFLIASGARPRSMGIPGEEYMLDSEVFMDLEDLPGEIVFVGGGYISVEFAGIAARAGSKVTLIHRGERLLDGFDSDMAHRVEKSLRDQGVEVLTGKEVKAVSTEGSGFAVRYGGSPGESVSAGAVVHGSGREPDIGNMNLEAAGVDRNQDGVTVNSFMQSVSNPSVYAAGDSAGTGSYKLTPVANIEGEAAGYNIVNGNAMSPSHEAIPTVVFSFPPLAMVGLTEEGAVRSGKRYHVNSGDSSGWYNSRRKGIKNSGYKIIVDDEKSEILGAHIFGDNSEEVINIFSLAMRHGIKVDELRNYPFAYPSDTTELRYMV